MRVLLLFPALLAFGVNGLNLDYVQNATQLLSRNNKGLFFDPHNHTSGVLSPIAVVNPKKFILGNEPSQEELKNFWFKFLDFYNEITCNEATQKCKANKLKSGPLLSNGTKQLLNCDEPGLYCDRSADLQKHPNQQCSDTLVRNIYNILSATPLTSFGGAYAVRRVLPDIPDLPGLFGARTQQRAVILALAMAGTGLVEMSHNFISEEKTTVFEDFQHILNDLKSPDTSQYNKDLKKRFVELGLKIPEIKWLLATDTKALGKISDTARISYVSGRCSIIKEESDTQEKDEQNDPLVGIYNTLVKFNNLVGVDVAGPEYTCFVDAGMNEFKKLASTAYRAAVERRKNNKDIGKLIVRVHVGEGAPLEDAQPIITLKAEERKKSCEAIKQFPVIKSFYDRKKNIFIHRYEAQKNIDYVIQAITELKEQNTDIDNHIIFRLGHLTHVTDSQAKLMKSLGISADVNLSSNISSQAWPVKPALIEKYLVKKGIEPINVKSLLVALKTNGATYEEIFDGHGIKNLLANKVPTTLGTDGGGVEHAPSLRREYLIADDLINSWNKNDAEFKKQGISIDFIFNSQQEHFKQMGYEN